MAEKANFYAWLELPVERFESDPAKLQSILDKKLVDWASNKSLSIQNRASIHGTAIKEAINDPTTWRGIYDEYVSDVKDKIASQLDFFDDAERAANVSKIAAAHKVSDDFIKSVAKEKGIPLGTSTTTPSKPVLPVFKLEDLEPPNTRKMDAFHSKVVELGADNLIELLKQSEFGGIIITETSDNDKVLEAINEMDKLWAKVSPTSPKGTKKSHVEKVRSGVKNYLSNYPFSDYVLYIRYLNVKAVLAEMIATLKTTGLNELNEKVFNEYVNRIFQLVEDRDKARGVLINYCESKNIAYPVKRAKLAVCPFCNNTFEREEPAQDKCPVCMKSLVINCPKCKSIKNLIVDSECDGINLQIYPLLASRLDAVHESCSRLNFEEAKSRLSDLNKSWPNYPGTSDAATKISQLESRHGADIAAISKHCSNNEYYAARLIIDRLNAAFPGFKHGFNAVYSEIAAAEQLFEDAIKQPDIDKRISLLLEINANIADFTQLNAELRKYPVEPVTDLTASIDTVNGTVSLNWKSKNRPNSVIYTIVKQEGVPVAGKAGAIATTQGTSFGDKDVKEGKAYYYAVYASRGPIESNMVTLSEPQVVLKPPAISVLPQDGSLNLSWRPTAEKLRVFYSDRTITISALGTEVQNISSGGVVIEGLRNGVGYQVAAYKSVNIGGKEYRSSLYISGMVTPIKPIEPPLFSKRMGSEAGEYILYPENDAAKNVEFYYTTALAGIAENAAISVADMSTKAKKTTFKQSSDGGYIVSLGTLKEMFIYPAVNTSGTLTVGNILPLLYVEPVKVIASISGSNLCLSLKKWPDQADKIVICYNEDVFPQDDKDCNRSDRIVVDKKLYALDGILKIPNVRQQNYYISLFALKGREYVPISTVLFENKKTVDIRYSMTAQGGLFGAKSIKLVITNPEPGQYRPAVTFAVSHGSVALDLTDAIFSVEIPQNATAPETEVFTINYPVKNDYYGKLFSSSPKTHRMLLQGSAKLK